MIALEVAEGFARSVVFSQYAVALAVLVWLCMELTS